MNYYKRCRTDEEFRKLFEDRPASHQRHVTLLHHQSTQVLGVRQLINHHVTTRAVRKEHLNRCLHTRIRDLRLTLDLNRKLWVQVRGRGWYVRRCLVRAMYLSASVVAVSTWGAISSARPLPYLYMTCAICDHPL